MNVEYYKFWCIFVQQSSNIMFLYGFGTFLAPSFKSTAGHKTNIHLIIRSTLNQTSYTVAEMTKRPTMKKKNCDEIEKKRKKRINNDLSEKAVNIIFICSMEMRRNK